ncbi:Nif3-like dinuclear metal center hexameric protein [Mycoplasmopsis pulmonis]|uniref:Nif3-like dinuclear metal center hexameric protein n=1 Tax=Mycoplasmopsis pulmonis TaxID=2107 RepID=UPI001004FCA4|nr:Nif3-like dinuclear metal center hexameric protein [Mycoplasmopsis pulmonis]VEU68220.1 Uncharacterized protein conserved in bacteria [Mycoplasmopsis pulmonis]
MTLLLEEKYPIENCEPWDFCGFSYKVNFYNREDLTGIVVALDLTDHVLEKAIEEKANLIITHHPFIYNNNLEEEFANFPYKEKIYNKLVKLKISVYSLHTNFDADKQGTSYWVAKEFFPDEKPSPLGKYGALIKTKIELSELKAILRKKYSGPIMTNNKKASFSFNGVAFFAGSGDSPEINEHTTKNNILITSDTKWSDWIFLSQNKKTLVNISHQTEELFIKVIYFLLTKKFKKGVNVSTFYYKNLINSL